ncbi:DNA primase [Qipengyuania zhejiangensis]|uniref:DNA primase n=1 Tax=Qipengyuania zhejiangensis TaxID=3077782 RepID=UPI002D79D36D|nr:DNA primase [Qipengyuania sp. Z2]
MALSPQWLDELRMRTTLSAVIGRTTRLTKAGREFKACCPFHNEKTPSFYVNDEKGFYHCFGCEAHGDAIRWLTDQRGMPFMDAVKELAAEAGMEVPAADPRSAERAEKRASLHDVTAAAQEWFAANLRGAEGAAARAYLGRRGFNEAIVREFGFGFAPEDRQSLKRALGRYEEPMLIEAGMRITVEDKEPYDRFRNRLMLPIHDTRGRVIAFGGRILDAEANPKAPKYLNSPDTPLFDKGRTLYNLHRAAPAARQSGRIIVVEGYMDAIALANAGIAEAVAPLGTALTENQIELLWRQVERPILCFDGDNAGQRAAMRAIARALPMLRPAHSLSIVRLPAGMDPDDLIREQGVGAIERLLAEPSSLLDTLWDFEKAAGPLDSPEDKAGLKARLLAHVETIQDPDIRSLYKRELLERFSSFAFPPRPQREFKPRTPWKKGDWRQPNPTLAPEVADRLRRTMAGGARDAFTRAVIAGLVRFPDQIVRHEQALSDYARRDQNVGPTIDLLLEAVEALDLPDQSPISLVQGLPAPPEKAHFAFLDEGIDPGDAREDLAEAVSLLVERPALESALAEATARFERDPEGSIAEQARLRERLLALNERLKLFGRRKAAATDETDS